jgi:hypothetical protein
LVEGVVAGGKKVAPKNVQKVNEQITLLEQAADEQPAEETLSPMMELYSNTINRTLKS